MVISACLLLFACLQDLHNRINDNGTHVARKRRPHSLQMLIRRRTAKTSLLLGVLGSQSAHMPRVASRCPYQTIKAMKVAKLK